MITPYQPDNQLPWLQDSPPKRSAAITKPQTPTESQPKAEAESNYWGDDGFTFGDLIDIINPLQHIPFINHAYRSITGDEISQGAKFAGGMAYGGALGMVSNVVQAVIEEVSGKTAEEHVVAMFSRDKEPETAPQQTAAIMKPLPQLYQAYAAPMQARSFHQQEV